MANQASVNWVTVLSFLQKQQTHSVMRDKQWQLQKQLLLQKIDRMQAELDASRTMIQDLLNRIKLLEIALFESNTHNSKSKKTSVKEQDMLKIESLIQKYKLEPKVKKDDHKQFLTQILNQIGIDSQQVIPQQKQELNISTHRRDNDLKLKQTGSVTAHLDGVRKIFANNGKDFLVSVSEDCLVKLWSYPGIVKNKYQHMEPTKVYREHAGPLFSLTGGASPFNPEESIFFTGGSDGMIKYWKTNNKSYAQSTTPVSNWSCSKQSDKDTTVWDLALNGNKLLSSGSDGYVNLYDINQSEECVLKTQFKDKQFEPTCLTWISQQAFIQGCSNAPRAQIWDVNGTVKQKFMYEMSKGDKPEKYQTNQICFYKSLKIFALACQDGALRLYPSNSSRIIRKIQLNSSISCVRQIKDWQLVCGTHSGLVSVWDLRNYQKILQLQKCHSQKYDEGIFCLLTEQDKIISGGADGIIKILS